MRTIARVLGTLVRWGLIIGFFALLLLLLARCTTAAGAWYNGGDGAPEWLVCFVSPRDTRCDPANENGDGETAEDPANEDGDGETAEDPANDNGDGETVDDPMDVDVFSYVPGGEGFGRWAEDVTLPEGYEEGDCGRVWQATNLKDMPWTFILCNWRTSEVEPKLQWPHPTQLTVSGSGIVEFELHRDHAASADVEPDPYDVANAQNSPAGLGWFFQGFSGAVCVNGDCQQLEGGGVYQVNFPHDMDGFYSIRVVVDEGQVQVWQGERFTTTDNWPLPEAVPSDS